jgi:ribA/ribD-fused uncharacterized protein
MGGKARLFGDDEALRIILATHTPAEAKAARRVVRNYDDEACDAARFDVVVRGNVATFGQHADLRAHLLATRDRVLVEASRRDRVWGIGMGASNPDPRSGSRS